MEAATFSALGEPSRLKIVELLRDGPAPVGEIAQTLTLRQPQASKHLRVLGDAGIVAVRPDGRKRIYRLEEPPFEQIGRWVDSFERLWDARLDSLDRFLGALAERPGPDAPDRR